MEKVLLRAEQGKRRGLIIRAGCLRYPIGGYATMAPKGPQLFSTKEKEFYCIEADEGLKRWNSYLLLANNGVPGFDGNALWLQLPASKLSPATSSTNIRW
eukprot:Trichotokara_eunicae@DN897_c0_g1_i1.p1